MIQCCGNCKHFFVECWLFPKINGECIAPRMRYDKKLKKMVEVSSGLGLRNIRSEEIDNRGRRVVTLFNWFDISPERVSCERFTKGKEVLSTSLTGRQDEIWRKCI